MNGNRLISLTTFALVCSLSGAGPLVAHDTWMLPARAEARTGHAVKLLLTSGMAFPESETAIDPARIARGAVRLAGGESPITPQRKSGHALELEAVLARPGVATLWLELHPRTIELDDAQVAEYLAEIGAEDSVRQRWQAMPAPRKWRELYAKHAKTFVRVGGAGDDRSWAVPAGMGLELVPEQDPTTLASGDTLSVRLLRDGAPAAGLAVGLVRQGETDGALKKTDAEGRAAFRLQGEGWWLLRVTDLRPSARLDTEWESHFTTLTVRTRRATR
jgi:uncharacterized GH25 family protein